MRQSENLVSGTDESQISELFERLKTCVLPRDEVKVRNAFKESVELRSFHKLNTSSVLFDLFLVMPGLVSFTHSIEILNQTLSYSLFQTTFDFSISFPDIDSNALFGMWSTLEQNAVLLYTKKLDETVGMYTKDEQVRIIAKLMGFLPTHRKTLAKSLKSLLTISEVTNALNSNLLTVNVSINHSFVGNKR